MTSLLASALEARKIQSEPDRLEAQVEGFFEETDTVVKLKRVHVHYLMKVPAGMRAAAERAVAVHERSCPISQSVQPAIAVTYDAEISELPA
jgi:uncharacterized OsmC-like protein